MRRAARPVHRATTSAAPRTSPGTSVDAGPVHAHAWVSSNPLGHGEVADRGVSVDTQITTVHVDGVTDRDPAPGVVCTLGVPCPE